VIRLRQIRDNIAVGRAQFCTAPVLQIGADDLTLFKWDHETQRLVA
jgi:hypothetical protein